MRLVQKLEAEDAAASVGLSCRSCCCAAEGSGCGFDGVHGDSALTGAFTSLLKISSPWLLLTHKQLSILSLAARGLKGECLWQGRRFLLYLKGFQSLSNCLTSFCTQFDNLDAPRRKHCAKESIL
jgi:hypothetical protein